MTIKRSILASTMLVLAIFVGNGVRAIHAQDRSVTFDGVYWATLTEAQKVFLIEGYVYGREAGFEAGKFAAVESLSDIAGVKGPRLSKAFTADDVNSGSGFTFGQLMSGIDECYKDFRNQKLSIDDCYVWTVWGIKGTPDATRENYLENMRKSSSTK